MLAPRPAPVMTDEQPGPEDHQVQIQVRRMIAPRRLRPDPFSLSVYGEPAEASDDLRESIQAHGILVPLAITPSADRGFWDVISGHRRLACALDIGLAKVPCEVLPIRSEATRRLTILEYNRYRRKTFSQLMREADGFEELAGAEARDRRLANLARGRARRETVEPEVPGHSKSPGSEREPAEGRNSDPRDRRTAERGRTDERISRHLGLGGKDLYRQARAVWRAARDGDARALSAVAGLDAGIKTIHAAYKDLRRRDRFRTGFRPTPYDVWPFRHDRAFGIPHPGSIPPAIVAHTLHYYAPAGALVVDPMAGGGTTLDVCAAMGRGCLSYDIAPTRPEIQAHDIRLGFPAEAAGCDLIFCDPPYHTMLAGKYAPGGIASEPFDAWIAFLQDLVRDALMTLRPGGHLALLLAPQTEKDIPLGHGYIDHSFLGYLAALRAGFFPERRISCPMDGAYLPQQVRRARVEGRLLGQVRDLLVFRKPREREGALGHTIPLVQNPLATFLDNPG